MAFFILILLLLLFGLSEDFLLTERVRLDMKRFDILFCDYVTVLLVKSVALSSTFLALANSLFSMSLDLLFDFDDPACFDNFDGLVINISIFFVCDITWFCDLNLRNLLLDTTWCYVWCENMRILMFYWFFFGILYKSID